MYLARLSKLLLWVVDAFWWADILFQYAELKPVPCTTYVDALAIRETAATPTLKQVQHDKNLHETSNVKIHII